MPIRRAQLTDASSIAVLSVEVWTGTYLRDGINAFFADYILGEFTKAKWEKLICDQTQTVWVSSQEGGIDGVLRLCSQSKAEVDGCSDWEIATLYVQPRHHGKGIGGRLLSNAFSHLRAKGATSVWLTTNAQNTPAIGFYLAQGFQQIGETHFKIGDEAYLNNIYIHRFD